MIYLLIFFEFFKAGLAAFGGGLVLIPILLQVGNVNGWYNAEEFADMVAMANSLPGPIGTNLATNCGYKIAGFWGAVVADVALVLPSLLMVFVMVRFLRKYAKSNAFETVMKSIRPAIVMMILFAVHELGSMALVGIREWALLAGLLLLMIKYEKNPIFYIIISAVMGLVLQL